MNQIQIDEIVSHQKSFFDKLDKAMDGELLSVSLDFPDIKDRIVDHVKWGLFLRKDAVSSPNIRTSSGFDDEIIPDFSPLVRINFHEVQTIEDEIGNLGFFTAPMFSEKINRKFLAREIEVYFSENAMEARFKEIRSTFKKLNTTELLEMFELRLTLPCVEDVFNLHMVRTIPDWQQDSIDAYDEWKWYAERDLQESYFQIGGNGNWIQNPHSDTYIAQVNNGVGDDGSVFILLKPNGEFEGVVEMY